MRKEKATVMMPLLEEADIKEIDVLAIQKPCYTKQTKSSYNPSTSMFHLVYKGKKDTRVCFYINKKLDIEMWEVFYSSKDFCLLKLNICNEATTNSKTNIIWVHNVYSLSPESYTFLTSQSFLPAVEIALKEPGDHILLGDFNLHHPSWNNLGRHTYHALANRLIAIIEDKDLELILPKNTVTWRSRGYQSMIDLIFTSDTI